MRIGFVLVLLLIASVRPAWAQDTHLPPLQALPASLTPAASTAGAPLDLSLQRNRGLGGFVGAIVGGGVVLLAASALDDGSSGDGEGTITLAAIGLGPLLV